MNCASVKISASRSRRIASLFFDLGFLVEQVELQLCRGLGAEDTCTSPALRYSGSNSLSRMMSVTRVLMPHCTLSGSPRAISSSQNCDELLPVDRGFLVGEDEEADAVVVHQVLDLVHHLDGIAHAVVAPELPLEQKEQVKGQPRAMFGMATFTPSGM
jgi:hypothetical protein